MQRSIAMLFDKIKLQKTKKVSCYVSYLQIYNEKIYDLLNPSMFSKKGQLLDNQAGLRLKWNNFDNYSVENLFMFECSTAEDAIGLFHAGIKNKVIGSHKMNMSSSRSHTVFTVTCEAIDQGDFENVITSKLQIVDLAGSER
jgi:hypothetical protein